MAKMLSLEIRQGQELAKKYRSDKKDVVGKAVRNVTLKAEREIKKATPVITGRLRSSVSHVLTAMEAKVGTLVHYAPAVEYGTEKVGARHMEGGRRVYGIGPFEYTRQLLEKTLPEDEKKLLKDMQVRLSD